MADKATVLKYVALSEFFRQRARMIARRILDRYATIELLNDPHATAMDIVDALALALQPLMAQAVDASDAYAADLGFPAPADSKKILAAVLLTFHTDAEPEIEARIRSAHDRLVETLDEGVSESAVEASLKSELGKSALFAGLLATLSGTASGFISEVERQVGISSYEAAGATVPLFRWDTVGDNISCEDALENSCDQRDGMEKSFEDWQALGLPGAPNLLCSLFSKSGFSQCRCVLGDAAVPRPEPGKIDASEAIKEGRAKADGSGTAT